MSGKMKYYSSKKIASKKCQYNVIFGERSNGKTTDLLTKALKRYFQKGADGKFKRKQFAYIRRWGTDIKPKRMKQMFAYLNSTGMVSRLSEGEFDYIHYYNGFFYLSRMGEDGKPVYSDLDVFGFTFSLNEYEHDKGASYPEVTTIIWDEFLTRGLYLTDEFVIFMNVVSTIIRLRTDIDIWLLGNTVNKYCPIFKEMGLTNILEMPQGTIDVYSYGNSGLKVAVEYCDSMKESKPNSYLFAFGNEKLEMITGGAWELDLFPHAPCKWRPKNIDFVYFIDFDNQIFQCEIVTVGEQYFTFIHEKTTPIQNPDKDLIYSLDYPTRLNHHRNIFQPITKLGERILWFYKTDRVFFQNNSVGNAVQNYLKNCRRSNIL